MAETSSLLPLGGSILSYKTPQKGYTLPTTLVPSQPSPLVASLLSVSRRANPGHSAAAGPQSTFASSFEPLSSQVQATPASLEELSWNGQRVTWSKGGAVYRSFSFNHLQQSVTQALFAYFPLETTPVPSPTASTSQVSLDDEAPIFGPFQPAPPPAWTDDPLALPTRPTTPRLSQPFPLARFLVIFLADVAYAYPPTGGAIPFQLPFHLRRAWAMDHGIILERAAEGSELWEHDTPAEMVTLYSLLDPTAEMKVVSTTAALSSLFPSPESSSPPLPSAVEPLTPVQDLQDHIIFASNRKDGSEPLLVSANRAQGKISVWSYARVPPSSEQNEAGGGKPPSRKGKERATTADILSPTMTTRPLDRTFNSSSKRKRPSFAGASHPPVSLGDRDRSLNGGRRISLSGGAGSTSFNGIAGGASGEADLLEALEEQMNGGHGGMGVNSTMRRTTSAMSSSLNAADRRTSVTRNELSITMDRMALGQGSRDGMTGTGGEMDREATLFLTEGEETRMVSDVLIQKVWEFDLAGAGSDVLDSASAHMFDSRMSSTSTLSILLPASATLLLLSVTRTPEGSLSLSPMHQLSATAHVPALVTRPNVLDLVFLKPDGSWGVATAADQHETLEAPPLPAGRSVVALAGDGSAEIVVILDNGSRHVTSAPRPAQGLARRCLEALSLVLPLIGFADLQQSVARSKAAVEGSTDWEALVRIVEGLFGVSTVSPDASTDPWAAFLASTSGSAMRDPLLAGLRTSGSSLPPPPASRSASMTSSVDLQAIVWTLHLVAQDAKLETTRQAEWVELAELVLRLAEGLEMQYWVDAYRRSLGKASAGASSTSRSSATATLSNLPPDLLGTLQQILRGRPPSTPFSLAHIASTFSLNPSNFYGAVSPLLLTSQLTQLYQTLAFAPPTGPSTTLTRAQAAVLQMHQFGWDAARIDRLAVGMSLPLREAVRMCQFDAPLCWPTEAYELVRRPDLARQVGGGAVGGVKGKRKAKSLPRPLAIDIVAERTKSGVPVDDPPTARSADDEMSTGPKAERFNEDRRLEEVMRMLQYSAPVTIGSERTLDQLTPNVQQNLLMSLSNRTLAQPVGFGMFTFRTRTKTASDSVPIPPINTSARLLPMPSPVACIEKEPRDQPGVGQDRFEWPEFHSGVAAALQLRVQSNGFDSAQISFNKPAELDAKHAGFLMGLGLVGQISSMVFNQAFEYLKMKHDPTSIGLLLGLAVTYIGTGDPKVTSLLTVHLAALHPPNSAPLNVSGVTQAAGLVGIGLLYLDKQRRNLADIMVREMCSIKVTTVEDPSACREAYALSAGFACGLIMLGSGRDAASTPGEVDLLKTFRGLILGETNHPLPGAGPSPNITDVNVTSPAATMAVALMYLRTGRRDVIEMLEIPDTPRRLDYVRSDLLLLRTLARSIIMWESVKSSKAWVDAQVPGFLASAIEAKKSKGAALDADLEIARWNIVAGACFAVGLKFAGTAAAEAHGMLIHYMDRLTRAAYVKASSVHGRIKRDAIRCCLSVVSISLAMVMAGTGELNVMRRLRVAHGHFGEGVTYGTHLASHMALGLLVVGSGSYTLGTSNSAIAALLLAFYPAFPSSPCENRAHLQAFRHLWTLAVEPRCLEARDVDTNEPTFVPIRLRLAEKGGSSTELRAKQLVAPTLIPELRLIHTIQVDTPRYWGFALRLADNPAHLASFLKEGILYVKRRTGHLSYAQDTRGVRSIFTKSKSETGSSVIDFGESAKILSPSAAGLREFVSYFSDEVEAKAAVAYLTRPPSSSDVSKRRPTITPSPFEAFSASVLLECLTRDKRDTVSVYLALYHAHHILALPVVSPLTLLALEQIATALAFYSPGGPFSTLFAKPRTSSRSSSESSAREPLVQPTFLDHVALTTTRRARALTEEDPQVVEALRSYLLHSEWPTSQEVASRLAIGLAEAGAPDVSALGKLGELVRAAKQQAEEAGMSVSEVQASVGMLVRGTKRMLEAKGSMAWSSAFGEMATRVWLE